MLYLSSFRGCPFFQFVLSISVEFFSEVPSVLAPLARHRALNLHVQLLRGGRSVVNSLRFPSRTRSRSSPVAALMKAIEAAPEVRIKKVLGILFSKSCEGVLKRTWSEARKRG